MIDLQEKDMQRPREKSVINCLFPALAEHVGATNPFESLEMR
jgi:hypothetical protein